MSSFVEVGWQAHVPSRYVDARDGLRLRVIDKTDEDLPHGIVLSEIGEGLTVAVNWQDIVVTTELAGTWNVSTDELVATATHNVEALSVEHSVREVSDARMEFTLGHHWVSSLMVTTAKMITQTEGMVVGVPRFDVLVTTPVVGAQTIDGLEMVMNVCDQMFDPGDGGISPYVWWWYQEKFWRLTDRMPDGTIDIQPHGSAVAFHFMETIQHLMSPCEECGRPG